MKLRKLYGSYKVTIPKPIVELLGWVDGDEIGLKMNDKGEIVLRKVGKKK